MKIASLFLTVLLALTACAPGSVEVVAELGEARVDAGCGQCLFGLEGDGCDLAIQMGSDAYFVDGSHIDDHGDAHADDGLCNAIRPAVVSGTIADGRFAATSFELLEE